MAPLITLALNAGLPVVASMLQRKLGDANGKLASDVLQAVATRAGVAPDDVEALAESTPGRVIEAMREVERMTPELLAAYQNDLRLQIAALDAEKGGPTWMRAWRPVWMYMLVFFWLWHFVILHVANAYWKIALPPLPLSDLLTLTGMFLALYMGGHTVLRLMRKGMTVDLADITAWGSVIAIAISVGSVIWGIFSGPSRHNAARLNHHSARLDEIERSLGVIKNQQQNLPSSADIHQLELSLVRANGEMARMCEAMNGHVNIISRIEAIVERHEEHLTKK